MGGLVDGWVQEPLWLMLGELLVGWVVEWVGLWMGELVNDRGNERTNEGINEYILVKCAKAICSILMPLV